MEKPWTWGELRRINVERGLEYKKFLKEYGLVGAVALELTNTLNNHPQLLCAIPDAMGNKGEYTKACNEKCLFFHLSCIPWTRKGRKTLEEWYVKNMS